MPKAFLVFLWRGFKTALSAWASALETYVYISFLREGRLFHVWFLRSKFYFIFRTGVDRNEIIYFFGCFYFFIFLI